MLVMFFTGKPGEHQYLLSHFFLFFPLDISFSYKSFYADFLL